jgi:hypothetical protein
MCVQELGRPKSLNRGCGSQRKRFLGEISGMDAVQLPGRESTQILGLVADDDSVRPLRETLEEPVEKGLTPRQVLGKLAVDNREPLFGIVHGISSVPLRIAV